MEWAEVIEHPFLKDIPFKIELNEWGKILMSPASNSHGRKQFDIGVLIKDAKKSGQIIIECSIQTEKGTKVADIAWLSDEFFARHGDKTPYEVAPEICVEVISPSNSRGEMQEKIKLYLDRGALEVWLCDLEGKITYYGHTGQLAHSIELNKK
ncbi:MAG: Uma2 family endonuclease [Cocleimonas sp.]|nr:Uma2 family endonuclease [Cocleimonas sp.]